MYTTSKPKSTEPTDTRKQAGSLPVSPFTGILVVAALYFSSLLIGQFAIGIWPLLQGWSDSRTEHWLSESVPQFGYVLVVEVVTISLLYFFLRGRSLRFSDLGLLRPRVRDLWIAAVSYPPYFLMNAVATLGAAALFHLDTGQEQQIGFDSVSTPTELLLTFISLVILPPIVEEIVMRGFLFGSLKSGMSVIRAALLTSLIFAVAHLQFGSGAPLLWTAAIDTFILSLVLCYLRQRTGSLWAGIGLHFLKNGLAFTAIFLLPHLHYQL